MTIPTKKYLTVEELAARWARSKWTPADVLYLIDEGLLLTTPKLAASKGKRDVRPVVVDLCELDERTIPALEAQFPDDCIEIVTLEPGESDSEAEARMWRLMAEDGDLQRVIALPEVERIERENPEWFAKPKRKPRPGGPREQTLYAVIAAMAKALEYAPGMSIKAGQGKLKAIKSHTNLSEKTIREVIENALLQADHE